MKKCILTNYPMTKLGAYKSIAGQLFEYIFWWTGGESNSRLTRYSLPHMMINQKQGRNGSGSNIISRLSPFLEVTVGFSQSFLLVLFANILSQLFLYSLVTAPVFIGFPVISFPVAIILLLCKLEPHPGIEPSFHDYKSSTLPFMFMGR
jgi:hypothetical protein